MGDLLARLQSALGDPYRIERELGGGGMSRVFLAQETALKRPVVIKVLPPEMAAGVNVERFRREVELAASLQHPHIVPLLSAAAISEIGRAHLNSSHPSISYAVFCLKKKKKKKDFSTVIVDQSVGVSTDVSLLCAARDVCELIYP